MKTLKWLFLAGLTSLLLVSSVGCSGVEKAWTCAKICTTLKECPTIDTTSCLDTCTSKDKTDKQFVDACGDCLDKAGTDTCGGAALNCGLPCAGIMIQSSH